ncbi:TfuA-like protein [Streptomyces sp. NPDC099088]|uniref:TfuA-like protein n=1 Tax=Streptomyces sp. NPDC099088 TaxID=3366101 RepID=UPI0037FA373C
MTLYLFVGPSLPQPIREAYAANAVVLPPVAAGELPALQASAGDTVAIIDGFFYRRPAVRHKEILDLLNSGVRVFGAASMGALRAAELAAFGMQGHGRIFTDYHTGVICADDEVALLHGTEAEDYEPYTLALVNVRYAFEDAADRGVLPRHLADVVVACAASMPFVERTTQAILLAVGLHPLAGSLDLAVVASVLQSAADVKRLDALSLLTELTTTALTGRADRQWQLQETVHLRAWRAEARGSDEPETGRVPNTEIHRLAQVLAVDYPAFRERVGLRALAESGRTEENSRRSVPTHAGLSPERMHAALVEVLRTRGLLAGDSLADPGLDRWCTAEEQRLPDIVRTAKAAARALFPHQALYWADPFVDDLKATGNFAAVHERLVQCFRFHRQLRARHPALELSQLRADNVLAHFSRRWGCRDVEDAVLERGFASIDDFLSTARSFYLYDKAHPRMEPLTVQPLEASPRGTI